MDDPRCPWCDAPDPHLIETSQYSCRRCHRAFVWLTPEDYAREVAASRPGLLVGDLLRGGIPVLFPTPDEPKDT